jgi:hydrogenase maturation protein HypF
MAENHLDGSVIGFALDGTGYGSDGHIWGGEVLVAGYRSFDRVVHLDYVAMPGGEAAVREPWRMAVSYLAHHFGPEFRNLALPFVQNLDRAKVDVLLRMVERNVNSPLTSSCGRLFDAVAALVGIRSIVNYEAQAAIELEMSIADSVEYQPYPVDLLWKDDRCVIQTKPMFSKIVGDLVHQAPVGVISRRFHDGLVETFGRIAACIRERTSLDRVCLSGGTFHNSYLLTHLVHRLEDQGFRVYTQKEVPAGDGGLGLGQALVALHQ